MMILDLIKDLDDLAFHYFVTAENIKGNYYNQLSIYIGVEDKPFEYQERFLRPELMMNSFYEPVIDESEELEYDVEKLKYEQRQFKKTIKNWEKDITKNIENIDEKLKYFNLELDSINEKVGFIERKAHFFKYIFNKKILSNTENAKLINNILNNEFYEEVEQTVGEIHNKILFNCFEKLYPIYNKILSSHDNVKLLKDLVKINETKINIDPNKTYDWIDGKTGINDFFVINRINTNIGSELVNHNFVKANEGELINHINKSIWCDSVFVNEKEQSILVKDDCLVFYPKNINKNYLLLLLSIECYRKMFFYKYYTSKNKNDILDLPIPVPNIEIQNYFADGVERYLFYFYKNKKIKNISKELKKVFEEQGEIAAKYFYEMKVYENR